MCQNDTSPSSVTQSIQALHVVKIWKALTSSKNFTTRRTAITSHCHLTVFWHSEDCQGSLTRTSISNPQKDYHTNFSISSTHTRGSLHCRFSSATLFSWCCIAHLCWRACTSVYSRTSKHTLTMRTTLMRHFDPWKGWPNQGNPICNQTTQNHLGLLERYWVHWSDVKKYINAARDQTLVTSKRKSLLYPKQAGTLFQGLIIPQEVKRPLTPEMYYAELEISTSRYLAQIDRWER